MSEDDQIAALREEIRRAGAVTWWLRLLVGGALLVALISVTARAYHVFNEAYIHAATGPEEGEAMFNGLATALVGYPSSVLVSLASAWIAALLYREARSRQLRRHVAPLSPQRREVALSPLLTARRSDTRTIARALQSARRGPAELAPAAVPDARGDEPSPAERAP